MVATLRDRAELRLTPEPASRAHATSAPAPLSVVRIIARLNMGGPARHVILLNRGLQARGHRTLLVHGSLGPGEGSLEHLAQKSRIRVRRIADLGRRISPLSDAVAFLRLLAIVFRESPDVLHTHTAKAGTLGRLAALVYNATRPRRQRCLVVHTFHGHVFHGYFHPAVDRLVRLAERSLARFTDRIVTISPSQHREITERFGIAAASKTVTIPLGLNLEALLSLPPDASNRRPDLDLAPNDVVVGYVGRMVPIKGLPTLVAAFARALPARPDLCLMLAGDGPLRKELEDLVARAGISARVRFVGWTEDLPRIYATMDVCALSSLNEGTPVAVIEAMAAAKAVAATSVGGVPDVIDHGRTGLLVPPGDVNALAGAILRLAADAEERRRLGEAARRHVATRYAPDRLTDEVDRLYASALARKRGTAPPASAGVRLAT